MELATGRFVVRRMIGRGGMGVVYEAVDRQRGVAVAIKVVAGEHGAAVERLKAEFRSLAEVVHPNLVRLHELFVEGDSGYFTMELVRGDPFTEFVREDSIIGFDQTVALGGDADSSDTVRAPAGASPTPNTGRFRERALRSAFRDLVSGVRAIHAAGKIHRDLKPPNVLVTRAGRVVILDFGLVSDRFALDASAAQGLVSGTPAYMAPEQAAALGATTASDYYALGVMLYEALTGALPFSGSALELLHAKQTGDPPRPAEQVQYIPPDLDALCMDLLQRAPAARPGPDEIVARLGIAPARVAPDRAPDQPEIFVGREQEFEALAEAVRAVAAGGTRAVFVHGPSGIGKTATIERFLQGLDGAAVILSGRCYERETVPFKAFDGVVDELAAIVRRRPRADIERLRPDGAPDLGTVFPALARIPGFEASQARPRADALATRRRAFTALKDLLRTLAEREPVVIFIDDLQWADEDSAPLFEELLGQPSLPRLLLIGSYRSTTEDTPFLRAVLAGKVAVTRLPLEPLPTSTAAVMAAELLKAVGHGGDLSEQLALECAGSPFFLGELVRSLAFGATPGGPVASSLATLVEDRVGRLPQAARAVLEAVAVAGREIPQSLAFEVAGLSLDEVAALDLLRFASLVRTRGPAVSDGVGVFHDRIRETVVAAMDRDRYRARHLRLGELLEASGVADPARLVEHFRSAGVNDKAGRYATLAGERAHEGLAFLRAAQHFEDAFALLSPQGEPARALLRKLGDARAQAGHGSDAAHAYERARSGADPHVIDELDRLAGEQYLRDGRVPEGVRLLRGLLERAGVSYPDGEGATIARFLLTRARIRFRGLDYTLRDEHDVPADLMRRVHVLRGVYPIGWSDPVRGALFMAEYALAALDAGVPDHVMHVIVGEGVYAGLQGGPKAEREIARLRPTVYALAEQVGTPEAAVRRRFFDVMTSFLVGRWGDVLAPSLEAAEILSVGNTQEVSELKLRRSHALLYLGRLRDLSNELPVLEREARESGNRPLQEALHTFSIYPWLARDDVAGARRALEGTRDMWGRRFGVNHAMLMVGEPLIFLYGGDAVQARDELRRRAATFRQSGLGRFQALRVPVLALTASCELAAARNPSERTAAIRLAKRAARRLAGEGVAWATPYGASLEGGIALALGRPGDALESIARAADGFEGAGMALIAQAHRRKWGELTGGAHGHEVVESADAFMRAEGIHGPASWARMQAPALAAP
jgi:hypothetical protein